MVFIISVLAILIIFCILKCILKFSLKIIAFSVFILAVLLTIWICVVQPDMHKPFSLNTIEYLFKINKDGSVTTTKQITTTEVFKQ